LADPVEEEGKEVVGDDKDILEALERLRQTTDGSTKYAGIQSIVDTLKAHGELIAIATEKQIKAIGKLEESSRRLEEFTTLLILLTFFLLGVTLALPLLERETLLSLGFGIVIIVMFLYFGRKLPQMLRNSYRRSPQSSPLPKQNQPN
jgi:hypothetical protein